jgi:hypothetical protein
VLAAAPIMSSNSAALSPWCTGVSHGKFPFLLQLPTQAVVSECEARGRRHGGLLLVRHFLTPEELSVLTSLLENDLIPHMPPASSPRSKYIAGLVALNEQQKAGDGLHAQLYGEEGSQDSSTVHRAEVSERKRWQQVLLRNRSALPSLVSRLRALPGVSPVPSTPASNSPLPALVACMPRLLSGHGWACCKLVRDTRRRFATTRGWETIQVASTGSRSNFMHHDRNKVTTRYFTALVYLGRAQVVGGHTIFPMIGAARKGTQGKAARGKGNATTWSDSVLSARNLLRKRIQQQGTRSMVLDDPETVRATGVLCAAVAHADTIGETPPVLAVPPTPGSAALFWNFGEEQGRPLHTPRRRPLVATGQGYGLGAPHRAHQQPTQQRPYLPDEVSNFHIPCGAIKGTKLAMQSFREIADAQVKAEVLARAERSERALLRLKAMSRRVVGVSESRTA